MNLKTVKLKEQTRNTNREYTEELLKLIHDKEMELQDYKKQLNEANDEINKLKDKLNLESNEILKEDENFKKEIETLTLGLFNDGDNEEIESLNNNIIDINHLMEKSKVNSLTLNEENISEEEYKFINLDNKENLIEDLKDTLINNNENETILLLEKIIKNIENLENNLKSNDIVLLVYVSYFYNRLEEILKLSYVVNEYYFSDNKEIRLLKIAMEEKSCRMYTSIEESIYSYVKKEKELFNDLGKIIKGKIIEKLYNVTYKHFEEVSSISSIEYGEETFNIKAWVNENNGLSWRLVEGLYSPKNDNLYLLESVIFILKLKVKEVKCEENKEYNETIEGLSKDISENTMILNKEDMNEEIIKVVKSEVKDDSTLEDEEKENDYNEEKNNIWEQIKEKIREKFGE